MQRFPACEGLQDRGCLCLALLTAGTEDNKALAKGCDGDAKEVENMVAPFLILFESLNLVIRPNTRVLSFCLVFFVERHLAT